MANGSSAPGCLSAISTRDSATCESTCPAVKPNADQQGNQQGRLWWSQVGLGVTDIVAGGSYADDHSEQIPYQGLDPGSILMRAKQLMK